jgi:predicted transcriptional regulator
MAEQLPLSLPFVAGSDTSQAAAESMRDQAPRIQTAIFKFLRGSAGFTCDEIERALGLLHQTASAQIRGLVLAGLVVDSGRRRPTKSRRAAVVWITNSETKSNGEQ